MGRIGAEVLSTSMDRVFTGLIDAVTPFGGDVLFFGGDALFVAFLGDDAARRAVDGAIAMRRALRAAVPLDTALGSVRIAMSVGVATGSAEIVVGDGPQRPLFPAGPTVSRTVRLESHARSGEIRVDAATADSLAAAELRAAAEEEWVVTTRRVRPSTAQLLPVGAPGPPSPRAEWHLPCGAEVLRETSLSVGEACDALDVCWVEPDVAADGATIVIAGGVPQQCDDDLLRVVAAARRIVEGELGGRVSIGVQRGTAFVRRGRPRPPAHLRRDRTDDDHRGAVGECRRHGSRHGQLGRHRAPEAAVRHRSRARTGREGSARARASGGDRWTGRAGTEPSHAFGSGRPRVGVGRARAGIGAASGGAGFGGRRDRPARHG
jgi:hypothetical protein